MAVILEIFWNSSVWILLYFDFRVFEICSRGSHSQLSTVGSDNCDWHQSGVKCLSKLIMPFFSDAYMCHLIPMSYDIEVVPNQDRAAYPGFL